MQKTKFTKLISKNKILLISSSIFAFLIFVFSLIYIFYPANSVFLNFYTNKHLTNLGEKKFLQDFEYDIAKKILEKAVAENPENIKALFLLGRISFVQGKSLEAINYFKKTLEKIKDEKEISEDDEKYKEQSYYMLGLAYGFMGKIFYEDAKNSFIETARLAEEKKNKTGKWGYGNWAIYNDLAWIYFLQGEFVKTEETIKFVLENIGHNAWLYNMLGSALLEQGKKVEAKKTFETALVYANQMTPEDFGQAYSGDDRRWYSQGLESMKKTIRENIETATK